MLGATPLLKPVNSTVPLVNCPTMHLLCFDTSALPCIHRTIRIVVSLSNFTFRPLVIVFNRHIQMVHLNPWRALKIIPLLLREECTVLIRWVSLELSWTCWRTVSNFFLSRWAALCCLVLGQIYLLFFRKACHWRFCTSPCTARRCRNAVAITLFRRCSVCSSFFTLLFSIFSQLG